jgi:hypothetical protein
LRRYGSLADTMPNHTMSVGDKWSTTRNIGTTGGFTDVDASYRFKNWEQRGGRRCARIDLTGTISPTTGIPAIERGKFSGIVWFDPELGVLTDTENDQQVQIKTVSGGQMLSAKLDQNVRLTLTDVAAAK